MRPIRTTGNPTPRALQSCCRCDDGNDSWCGQAGPPGFPVFAPSIRGAVNGRRVIIAAGARAACADGAAPISPRGPPSQDGSYVALCQTTSAGAWSDIVPGATVGNMGPGVPTLREESSSLRTRGRAAPASSSRGRALGNKIVETRPYPSEGLGVPCCPTRHEGSRHPEALARLPRGGRVRRKGERHVGSFMGSVPNIPAAFNAAWWVVRRLVMDV